MILGGHGITAWGDTSDECERNSLWIIDTAAEYIATHGKPEPFGPWWTGIEPLPDAIGARQARRAGADDPRASPRTIFRWSGTSPTTRPCSTSCHVSAHPRLAALGTSCPDHFLRTKVKPMVLDLPGDGTGRRMHRSSEGAPRELSRRVPHVLRRPCRRPDSPPMRGADPLVVLVPGVGMFSFGRNKQTARVAGEFYLNAINVMRGAEALSTYAADQRCARSSGSSTGRSRRPSCNGCRSRSRTRPGWRSSPAPPPASARRSPQRLAADGACVVVADLDAERPKRVAAELGDSDVAVGVGVDVSNAEAVAAGSRARRCWRSAGST